MASINNSTNISVDQTPEIDWKITDLVTCVELNYTNPDGDAQNEQTDGNVLTDVYHFVYASNLYGTLFGIYGKFNCTFSPDGNECTVTGVDLQLLNYEGVLNVGFCDVDPNDIPTNAEERHFYFGVQGGSLIRSIKLTFKKPVVLKKGIHKRIKFIRVLYPLKDFNLNSGTDVYQQLGKIPATSFFDTEFHYRSGIDFYNSPIRPGMTGFKEKRDDKMTLVTVRCHQSNVNLLYY